MKALPLTLCLFALSAGAALAQPPRLANLDANGDGAITLAEAQAPREEMFKRLDANGDNQVTKTEADAAREEMQARRPEGAPEGRRPPRAGGERFERLDVNGDQIVTREEFFAAPNPLFDRFDANKDSVLDAAEQANIPQRGRRS